MEYICIEDMVEKYNKCQNDFITGSLGSDDAVKVLPNIKEKVKCWVGDAN